jgi:hypothetical protein
MIGYKLAKNAAGNRVVVTLEIPDDALTNVGRESVVVPETATYRANKARVVKIEDAAGMEHSHATSLIYGKKSLPYTVGETIVEPGYAVDPETICGEGIHFFLTRRVAELYGLNTVENGLFQRWHDNGQKKTEVVCLNGVHHGAYQSWHPNGHKDTEATYVNGKYHGLCQRWWCDSTDEELAFYQQWPDGQKLSEVTYVNGKPHGLFTGWHYNGRKSNETTYVNGIAHGLYQQWNPEGELIKEVPYMNGVCQ